jgi:hypothetical protein
MNEIIEWITTNLTTEKVAVFGQFLVSGGALTWAVSIYNKFKTQAIKTPADIQASVESKIQSAVEGALKPLNAKIDKVVANEKVVAESIALLANNDTKSKLALLENISKIEVVDKVLIEDVKTAVVEEIKQEAIQEQKVEEALKELEKPVEYL